MKKRMKGFTLIELIAVLVILVIIALIVTPIVMSVIRKSKLSADKRSIDAYGRSIEIAIATYLLDTGDFPTDISQLTIDYSGSEVVCEIIQLNSDSSVYLSGCTVGGRSVDYTYGIDKSPSYNAYSVGDEVIYNGVDYYVIKDNGIKDSVVTLLKAEPLTVSEVNEYGAGHINKYTTSSVGTAYDYRGYGGMAYYSSSTCGFVNKKMVYSGCTTNYDESDVKYAVDAWKNVNAPSAIEARLIQYDELPSLGYEMFDNGSIAFLQKTENTPSWLYNSDYLYWTMSPEGDSSNYIWNICETGEVSNVDVFRHVGPKDGSFTVRPVIVLSKSVL